MATKDEEKKDAEQPAEVAPSEQKPSEAPQAGEAPSEAGASPVAPVQPVEGGEKPLTVEQTAAAVQLQPVTSADWFHPQQGAGGFYTPEEDVIQTLPDGRTIQVAVKGTPVPMAQAHQLGLVKEQQSSGPSETK